jgi:hypothetical protein
MFSKSGRVFWGEVLTEHFRTARPEFVHQVLDPLLGSLKVKRHSIFIHRLEKDLLYLAALSMAKCSQLFFSFPVSPVSLGTLLIAYQAHIPKSLSKSSIVWIRPKDNGGIYLLRTTNAFNLLDADDTLLRLSEKITLLPSFRADEPFRDERIRVLTARSLEVGIELVKQQDNFSLVILDDPSGRTYLASSNYGNKAFELANVCKEKNLPLVGIVPPWTMKDLEKCDKSHSLPLMLWPIDSNVLRSYSEDYRVSDLGINPHPIEESFLLLERKRQTAHETKVSILTVDFEAEKEEIIAEHFRESSELMIQIAKEPGSRSVWSIGWEIWRDLSAPVLPPHLMWEKFLKNKLHQLELATTVWGNPKGLNLFRIFESLTLRLCQLHYNPFLEVIDLCGSPEERTFAVADAARAEALEEFLNNRSRQTGEKISKVVVLDQVYGLGGKRLIIFGQPKARHRDILQTTFFHNINVLLWAVLAERAERWWKGLEISASWWHQYTWQSLSDQTVEGHYSSFPTIQQVEVISLGKMKPSRRVNLARLEESFDVIGEVDNNQSWADLAVEEFEAYYLVELENKWKIRTSPMAKMLVLAGVQTHVVPIKDLTPGEKLVLFDGMGRDELFLQKAGLLENSRVNHRYRTWLTAWRKLVLKKIEARSVNSVSEIISAQTGISIGPATIRDNWMRGEDLLSLPEAKEHFFWFIHPDAHSAFEEFWEQANDLRIARRKLGQVISACVQEGWSRKNPDEIVFQHKQVFITVGELKDSVQILKVQTYPKFINQKPSHPLNRLFRE